MYPSCVWDQNVKRQAQWLIMSCGKIQHIFFIRSHTEHYAQLGSSQLEYN